MTMASILDYTSLHVPTVCLYNLLLFQHTLKSLFVGYDNEHPWTYALVHLSRYIRRINRKVLSCEPHCLTLEPLFPNTLPFAEGDRKIVLASVEIRVMWAIASPSLPDRKTNQGRRAESLSSAHAPWTRWFISACLSRCRLWT